MNRRRAVIAGLAVVGVLAAILVLNRGSNDPDRVSVVDLEVVDRVAVGESPQAVAATSDNVYVANLAQASVSVVDAGSLEVTGNFQVGALPAALVATRDERLWIGFAEGPFIAQFEGDSGRVVGRALKVGSTPQGLAVAGANLWVAALNAGKIARVNLARGEFDMGPERIESDFPSAIAVGFGSVWVTDVVDNKLFRLGAGMGGRQNLVVGDAIDVGDSPTAVTVGHGSVWVANFRDGTVSRVDPDSNEVVAEIRVGKGIGGISAGDDYVWLTTHQHGSVVAIDPAGNGVAGVERVGRRPQGVVATGRGAWVVVQGTNELVRVEPAGS